MKKLLSHACYALGLLLSASTLAYSASNTPHTNKTPDVWLTVFVHGIMSVKPHLSPANFLRFMTDNVENTVYSKTVELMRHDPIYYQNQAMQEPGLHPIDRVVKPGNASGAMALMFETMSSFAYRNGIKPENHYYTFGWSGLLSPSQRVLDARQFYRELSGEIKRFQQQGITPHVRVIGYSHGGNLCLNLARARQTETDVPPFSVDELVLLGMPVQYETDYLVNDPIFKRIYHLYSRADRIQKLDFFSFHRFFSRRIFKSHKGFKLPEKLIQIQIKSTRLAADALDNPKRIASTYNFTNRSVVSGKFHYLRDISPGHSELWFFGWTPVHYRTHFSLSPMPAAAYIPLILQMVGDFQEKSRFKKPTLIDIRPEHEVILIKNQKSRKVLTIAQFLPHDQQEALKEQLWHFKPEQYTQARYSDHIMQAYDQAKDFYQNKRIARRELKKQKKLAKKQARRERKRAKHQAQHARRQEDPASSSAAPVA